MEWGAPRDGRAGFLTKSIDPGEIAASRKVKYRTEEERLAHFRRELSSRRRCLSSSDDQELERSIVRLVGGAEESVNRSVFPVAVEPDPR